MGSKIIQEKNNEKETVIIDEVTRTTVEDVRPVVESDSQVRSRDTGEPTEKRKRQAESAAERKSASRSRRDANIDNLKCQDCKNEEVHICCLDELEDIETVNELNIERGDNEEYYDTQVVESDSVLTEEEKKVYEILKKKKDILSKAVKDRSDEDKKMLKHYINKLTRNKSKIIIPDLLKKCPELRKQNKTGAQRLSALRSRQDEQHKNEDRLQNKNQVALKMLKLQRKGEEKTD